MNRKKDYQSSLLASLKDPVEAAEYLNAALEKDDIELFPLAIRNVSEARLGGISKLAETSGLNRESLYRMLLEKGNPKLHSLNKILTALGLRLSIESGDKMA